MTPLKGFYNDLYERKKTEGYENEVEFRRDDFIHRYILFFLDPSVNSRHEVVRKILTPEKRYLDVGCWDGDSTLHYGSLDKFEEVYGIDISEKAVWEAQKKGINAHPVDLNSEFLPFPDDFFDVVTFIDVIEHLIQPFHVLEEIRRVLRSRGRMVIGTANVASLSNRLRVLLGMRPRTSHDDGWDGGHLLYFTPGELESLLERYGFAVYKRYATGNMQLLRKIFFNFSGEIIFDCLLGK